MMRFAKRLLIVVVASLWAAVPAHATLSSGNLLQNPDAESGRCGTGTGDAVPIPGWTTTLSFTVVCYASDASQPASAGAQIGGGNGYFFGGVDAQTSATQLVDVSWAARQIDAGNLPVELAGYLGGWQDQDDQMATTATFLSASGGQLGSPLQIGPVLSADRGGQTELLLRTSAGSVPVGTRSIRVTMTATRISGFDNDAAADNLSLSLGTNPPPPVPGRVVDVKRVSGSVLIKTAAGFVPLTQARQISVGSVLDATKGSVSLLVAKDRHGHAAAGQVSAGAFRLAQKPERGTERTILWLAGPKPSGCRRRAGAARSRPRHRALVVRDPGAFTTYGVYASAADRGASGTKWLTEDTCAGTLVKVLHGSVLVHDFPHHHNFVLLSGHSFLVHPGAGG